METRPRPPRSPCAPTSARSRCSRPSVRTDAGGRATVPVTVPESLTRYRITAVAVSGARNFGKGESTVTARLPLMVRPSAPRFLNFGDRFDLPVVVQNQTESPMTVDVAVRASNADLTRGRGPPGDRPRRRPRGDPLPGHDGPGGHRALPGGRRLRTLGGRGGGRAAGVDARDHRGLCDLRPDRRRGRAPAHPDPARRRPAVRRARGHHVVHRALGPDRRGALSRRPIPSNARSSSRRGCSRWPRSRTCSPPSRPRDCRRPRSSRPPSTAT